MSQVTLINMTSDGILPPHYVTVLYSLLLIIVEIGPDISLSRVVKRDIYSFVKYEVLDEGDLQHISIWRRVQWLERFLTWEVPGWNLTHKTNYPQLFMVLSNLIKMLTRKITPSDWPRLLANTTFLIHHSYHFDTGEKVVAD